MVSNSRASEVVIAEELWNSPSWSSAPASSLTPSFSREREDCFGVILAPWLDIVAACGDEEREAKLR